jgi:sodium pump decarboxylase gamma subunit
MNETLMQGVSVMLIGMGTVVAFLCVTIISMFVMSFIVGKLNKLFPEVVPAVAGGAKKVASSSDDSEVAAAIVAALFKK